MEDNRLRLASLLKDHGLSDGYAPLMVEAAAVCLESQGHQNEADYRVFGDLQGRFVLCRHAVDDRALQNHRDEQKATEFGACGVAILSVRKMTGMAVVQSAAQMDGIDYWIGDVEEGRPLNKKARLEASGIRRGGNGDIDARVRQKEFTTRKSDGSRLPVYVVVVEFSRPVAKVVKR